MKTRSHIFMWSEMGSTIYDIATLKQKISPTEIVCFNIMLLLFSIATNFSMNFLDILPWRVLFLFVLLVSYYFTYLINCFEKPGVCVSCATSVQYEVHEHFIKSSSLSIRLFPWSSSILLLMEHSIGND